MIISIARVSAGEIEIRVLNRAVSNTGSVHAMDVENHPVFFHVGLGV